MNVRRPDDPNEAFGASPPGLLLRIFFSSINPSERGKRRLVAAGCALLAVIPMGELDEKAGVWV